MRISVVVPVYNEEETVAQVLETLAQVPLNLEVVVVDDASTDRTWEILQGLRTKEQFASYRFVRHERNQGKGAGLCTGFGLVSGDMVTVQDADMEYDPQDLPALLNTALQRVRLPQTQPFPVREAALKADRLIRDAHVQTIVPEFACAAHAFRGNEYGKLLAANSTRVNSRPGW